MDTHTLYCMWVVGLCNCSLPMLCVYSNIHVPYFFFYTSKILLIVYVNAVSFGELHLSAHTNPPLLFLFSFFLHFVCHASLLWLSLDTLSVSLFHPLSLFLFRSVIHFVPFKHIWHSITPPSFLLVLSSTFPYSSFLHPSFTPLSSAPPSAASEDPAPPLPESDELLNK
jgi:hypothetical protein